jgi:four helix bundle protein
MQNNKEANPSGKEKSYCFALDILQFSSSLSKTDEGRIVKNQVIRSATSIGANIVEASGSSSLSEYKRFFEIALRSGNETKYWLALIKDANLTNKKQEVERLINDCQEICKIIGKSIITIKAKLKK